MFILYGYDDVIKDIKYKKILPRYYVLYFIDLVLDIWNVNNIGV